MLKKPLNKIRYPFLGASFTENVLPFKKLNRKAYKLKNLSNKKGLSYRIGQVQKNIIEQETTTKIESTLTKQDFATVENINSIHNFIKRGLPFCDFLKHTKNFFEHKPGSKNLLEEKKEKIQPCLGLKKRDRFYKSKYIFSLGQLKAEFSRKQKEHNRHNKYSHFKTLLEERKKCMIAYGCLNKKQMQSLFLQAKALHGKFDENFIKIAESRLDVTLFRICFFPTIFSARQWINHGHILVNNSVINLPGYQLKAGDVITVASDKKDKLKQRICLFIAEKTKIRAFHYSIKVKAFYAIIKSCVPCQLQGMEQTKKRKMYNLFKKIFLRIVPKKNQRLPLFHLLPKVFLFFSKARDSKNPSLEATRRIPSTHRIPSLYPLRDEERDTIRGSSYPFRKGYQENQKNQEYSLFYNRVGDTSKGYGTQLLPFLKMRNLFTSVRPLRQRVGTFKISGMKPLNLEVCYKKMVAIFLYSPQKVALPASIDLHLIAKSIK